MIKTTETTTTTKGSSKWHARLNGMIRKTEHIEHVISVWASGNGLVYVPGTARGVMSSIAAKAKNTYDCLSHMLRKKESVASEETPSDEMGNV